MPATRAVAAPSCAQRADWCEPKFFCRAGFLEDGRAILPITQSIWTAKPNWLRQRSRSVLRWWCCHSKAACRPSRRRPLLRSKTNHNRWTRVRTGKSGVNPRFCGPKLLCPRFPGRAAIRCRVHRVWISRLKTKSFLCRRILISPICCLLPRWPRLRCLVEALVDVHLSPAGTSRQKKGTEWNRRRTGASSSGLTGRWCHSVAACRRPVAGWRRIDIIDFCEG